MRAVRLLKKNISFIVCVLTVCLCVCVALVNKSQVLLALVVMIFGDLLSFKTHSL